MARVGLLTLVLCVWANVCAEQQRVLVYGGNGQLGDNVVAHFKSNHWETISVDFSASSKADKNILVQANASLTENVKSVLSQVPASCECPPRVWRMRACSTGTK